MQYSGIIYDDLTAAPGLCVSFFTQGCPHHCQGCHNPETWDFNGGKEFNVDIINKVCNGLTSHGLERSLCIMGGEPLCQQNQFLTRLLILEVKKRLPNIKIYIWSGYTLEELLKMSGCATEILKSCNFLIDGRYEQELRDITLPMRGSSNQRIIDLSKIDFEKKL